VWLYLLHETDDDGKEERVLPTETNVIAQGFVKYVDDQVLVPQLICILIVTAANGTFTRKAIHSIQSQRR